MSLLINYLHKTTRAIFIVKLYKNSLEYPSVLRKHFLKFELKE